MAVHFEKGEYRIKRRMTDPARFKNEKGKGMKDFIETSAEADVGPGSRLKKKSLTLLPSRFWISCSFGKNLLVDIAIWCIRVGSVEREEGL